MRLPLLGALAATAVLVLTGCTPAEQTREASVPTAAPAPGPTIDPGPVALDEEKAGARYLGIVCQQNTNNVSLGDAFAAQEDAFLNGSSTDVVEVNAAGAEALRVNRLSVELIDDTYYTWPDGIDEHLETIRASQMALASFYNAIANASSYEDAYYTTSVDDAAGATAAQEIRYQLGLSADTTTSCEGFETSTEELHAEMIERNAYLATFSAEEE